MSWDNSGGNEWDAGDSGGADQWGADDSGAANTWRSEKTGAAAKKRGGDADFTHGDNHLKENRTADGQENRTPGDEAGYSEAGYPNPRMFSGNRQIREKQGDPAAEYPEKPPMICRNCKKEGHAAKDCKENRVLDLSAIPDEQPEIAWQKVVEADGAKDLHDLREAVKIYCKAVPETTWEQLEQAFRMNKFNTFLIAREKGILVTQTLINLQGKLDCKYEVGYFFSDKPRRAILAQGWPSSSAENLERLKDAGLPMDRGVPKCGRCSELGHIARDCKEEAGERERTEVKCVNCDLVGHRARDCPEPRKDKFACRNCKQSGHQASECTEPRSAEGVECKRCGETGHFAKDCPTGGSQTCRNCGDEGHKAVDCDKPKNPANATCRNCDAVGHFSKDCPEKKDWSRVKCNRCNEMGHTVRRCPQPDPDAVDTNGKGLESGGGGDNPAVVAVAEEGDWANTSGADNDWETDHKPKASADGW